jgi:hypothetical protein
MLSEHQVPIFVRKTIEIVKHPHSFNREDGYKISTSLPPNFAHKDRTPFLLLRDLYRLASALSPSAFAVTLKMLA